MLSNKLTFSLASLVFLLAFAFVAMPVMAAPGGPTVEKIIVDPETTTQVRNAFVVQVTFSAAVTTTDFVIADDITVRARDMKGALVGNAIVPDALTAVTTTGTTSAAFTFTLDVSDAAYVTARKVEIMIVEDAVMTAAGQPGSQPKTETLDLPPVATDKVKVEAKKVEGEQSQFTVTFTFGAGTAPPTTLPATTDLSSADIMFSPAGSAIVTAGPTVGTTAGTNDGVYTATVALLAGASETTVSVDPGFAAPADEMGSVTLRPGQDPTEQMQTSTGTGVLADDEVTLSGSILGQGFVVIRAAQLPDLNAFFVKGGTISLIADAGTGATARTATDVVISEILWGLDQAKGTVSDRAMHQFIELYNTTGASIDLGTINAKLSFDDTSVVPTDPGTDKVYLDQVSNVHLAGWVVDVGQSGRLSGSNTNFTPTDIISMYRNIDYVKVEKAPAAGTAPTADERTAQLKDFPDGKVKGSWKASTKFYMTGIIASPGAKHTVPVSVLTPTAVPYSPVIISEIGNYPDANKDHNWIELLAVADVNLKNYELAYIMGGTETTLIHFNKDKDQNLVAGDILLIANKDPRETMLARGKKFGDKDGMTPDEIQDKRGGVPEANMYYDAAGKLDALSGMTADTNKFLLVLRSEPKDNHEKIIDIVGTDFHADTTAAYRTAIWPLQGASKGHDDVIDGDPPEVFKTGYVYKRNDKTGGTGEHDWAVVGYTGIGYDREAPMKGQYGGTPGFANDAEKSKPADIGSDVVTISEIMVVSQEGRFPQWIELRNSSATLGVNLDNWKLRVENVGEVTARKSVTIDLPNGYRLPPNGTILIATRPGTASEELSKSRVINLYLDVDTRRKIEAPGPSYTLLSMEGFTLKLFGDGQKETDSPVDIVTIDADMLTEELIGNRSGRISLIRYYSGGTPGAWGSAVGSNQVTNLLSEQFYGHRNDVGTPGWYPGGALPVELSSFRPLRDKATGTVVIRWATESELDNAGFNILRSETKKGEFKVVNLKGIIAGHGTTSEKHTYEWKDTTAKPNVVYYYQIEDVSLDGKRTTLATTHLRGNVNAAGKLTTTWSQLKDSRY